MSRDWNEQELQMASAEMKRMGYMSYEEFCEYLKTHPMAITKTAISDEVVKEFKEKQLAGEKMPCPRCGKDRMRTPATHNCLSREIDVYVCEVCGAAEAINAMKGLPFPLECWDLYARLE